MNLTIPRKSASELIIYIWKIMDLPSLSLNELIFKISFEFFVISPQKAKELVIQSINKGLLIKNENDIISLSKNLEDEIKKWQQDMKSEIRKRILLLKKSNLLIEDLDKEKSSDFNTILKAFLDKGTINRAATLSDSNFYMNQIDLDSGKIETKVSGTEEKSYYLKIDLKNKTLNHNCHDFETRRAKNKKFCKHLAKFFLLLKEKNEQLARKYIEAIAENINDWVFSD